MKTEDLIKTAEELNEVIGLNPAINTKLPPEELTEKIKEGALWLWATDVVGDESILVLKKLKWTDDDFNNIDKEKQDPLPAFKRYGIIPDDEVKEVKPKKKKKAEPKTQAYQPEVDNTTTPPKKKPTPEPEAEEHMEEPKPKPKVKGPSAYGTAIAILGANPTMPLSDLYEVMRKKKFDLSKTGNSIKTAHSICKKIYYLYKANGFLK